MIFPADRPIDDELTLENLDDILVWYSHVNPERSVSIVNEMKKRIQDGEQIFYDIYTEEEKKEDPAKENNRNSFGRRRNI